MNLTDIFKLMPLMPEIQKMVSTAEKYMNDPEVPKALNLVRQIEADPDVKEALATAESVAKILTVQGT